MNIINNGNINKIRKGSIPATVKNNKDFTYGMRSDVDAKSNPNMSDSTPVKSNKFGGNQMHDIFAHSDNLKDTLQKKIY